MKSGKEFLAALVLTGLFLPGCDKETSSTSQNYPEITPQAVTYAPISTFEQSCAKCHGPAGSFFGETFGQEEAAVLFQTTQDMMKGPAFLTPETQDVQAMTDYLQALAGKKPYMVITHWDSNTGQLSGEATPPSQITLVGLDRQAVSNADGAWTFNAIPPTWSGVIEVQWPDLTQRYQLR